MIPKKIHYCWFGGKELPKEAKECIESWKKYFPDYEIIEWNESTVELDSCEYVKQAYERKKWAFVSDYFRFQGLYEYGGIYFDTDVKVLQSMESVIKEGAYFAKETERDGGTVNSGLGMAVEPHNAIYKEMLDSYNKDKFINKDGSENLTTVCQRMTKLLIEHGYDIRKEYTEIQCVDGIKIYPSEYFCPMGYDGITNVTPRTYTIHLYNASWFSKYEQRIMKYNMKKNQAGIVGKLWYRIVLKIMLMGRKTKC